MSGKENTRRDAIRGSGLPNCKECGGRGAVDMAEGPHGIPQTRRCRCVLLRDIQDNVERGWKGLILAPKIESSVLLECLNTNLKITANELTFKAHLRHVALRQGPDWKFKVTTDAGLMSAWLANMAVMGKEVFDPDAMEVTSQVAFTLEDLVVPPELLVIRLGVKAARNSAMPEVLLESLTLREHVGKPTWILDHPSQPLSEGHLCYSDAVGDYVSTFKSLDLVMDGLKDPKESAVPSVEVLIANLGSQGSPDNATKKVSSPWKGAPAKGKAKTHS